MKRLALSILNLQSSCVRGIGSVSLFCKDDLASRWQGDRFWCGTAIAQLFLDVTELGDIPWFL